jgi:septum site-determining protein MinD
LGVIPESPSVLDASNQGKPIVVNNEASAGQAYQDVIQRMLGQDIPLRFINAEKKGFFKRIFGGA